ncbi:SMC domain protein [Chloroherpeton thalassium ATCC 35110]|uniref:SMC domain protein n=1 Tax=Chloroherpeton thalassium (strain ATCC 35110 / GB-78) TaxID=517418 RepID=B3QZ48_CHLT3|nr:AAA family ATPase [Chloroherpeton thalassium]ACF13741.1 SMC domain protein [Chloroherpeton thalassium ATCC 35110]
MQIEQLHVKNYKVFKDTEIRGLSNLCVFLGPNGSGKSTLFDVFGFLSDALQSNVTIAVNRRGGVKEVLARGCDPEKDELFFELKFRNPNAFENDFNPVITYQVRIGFERGKAIVRREILRYRRGRKGKPWHFLDFQDGAGSAIVNEQAYGEEGATDERENKVLSSPDILAVKGLGQFEQFRAVSEFRKMLEKWYISSFSIDAARRVSDTGLDEHLNATGENLAQVTKYIYEYHRDIFDQILHKLPQRIPGISKVEAVDSIEGKVVLRFQDENFVDPFIGKFVSDGTIKMFAYMILLYDPDPHPLLCIEEPENFLHPDLLVSLAEEIREYAERGGQVFVSTHSPDFVNALDIDELFFLVKDGGFSQIKAASEDELTRNLHSDGNKLGWLWRNHYIKGANLK